MSGQNTDSMSKEELNPWSSIPEKARFADNIFSYCIVIGMVVGVSVCTALAWADNHAGIVIVSAFGGMFLGVLVGIGLKGLVIRLLYDRETRNRIEIYDIEIEQERNKYANSIRPQGQYQDPNYGHGED